MRVVFQGVMLEQAFKDLPKHITKLGGTLAVVGQEMVDRLWTMKAEVDRRVAELNAKGSDTSTTTKRTTARPPTTTGKALDRM